MPDEEKEIKKLKGKLKRRELIQKADEALDDWDLDKAKELLEEAQGKKKDEDDD